MSHFESYSATCQFCGGDFQARSPQAKFCCDACRLRWFRFKQRVPDAWARANRAIDELIYLRDQQCTGEDAHQRLEHLLFRLREIVEVIPVKQK